MDATSETLKKANQAVAAAYRHKTGKSEKRAAGAHEDRHGDDRARKPSRRALPDRPDRVRTTAAADSIGFQYAAGGH